MRAARRLEPLTGRRTTRSRGWDGPVWLVTVVRGRSSRADSTTSRSVGPRRLRPVGLDMLIGGGGGGGGMHGGEKELW